MANTMREQANDDSVKESPLVTHARRELRLAGLFDEDADYTPRFAERLVDVIRLIDTCGHSGASLEKTRDILNILLSNEALTPLTSNPDEWELRSKEEFGTEIDLWQNIRNSSAISENGGKTWYLVTEPPYSFGDHIYTYDTGEYLGVVSGVWPPTDDPEKENDRIVEYNLVAWGQMLYKSRACSSRLRHGPDPTAK